MEKFVFNSKKTFWMMGVLLLLTGTVIYFYGRSIPPDFQSEYQIEVNRPKKEVLFSIENPKIWTYLFDNIKVSDLKYDNPNEPYFQASEGAFMNYKLKLVKNEVENSSAWEIAYGDKFEGSMLKFKLQDVSGKTVIKVYDRTYISSPWTRIKFKMLKGNESNRAKLVMGLKSYQQ